MSDSRTIRALDPRSFPVVQPMAVPRLQSLDGAKIGFLWNNRPRGDLVLRGLAQRLEQAFNTETLFTNKLRVGTGASDEELRRLDGWVDAVVVGVGD